MLRSSLNRTFQQINRNLGNNTGIKCKRLEEKVAIVTASTSGIGFAIAKRLAEEGAKVVISSRKESNVQQALKQLKSKDLNVYGTICHVGKNEDRKSLLEKTIQEFGSLDILILSAGTNPNPCTLFDTSELLWDKIFDINLKSTFLLMKDSLPFLRKSKSASIILLSSIAAYSPLELLGAYAISKTALLGLTQMASVTLASEGIRVNCIAPGIINTKFSQILREDKNMVQNAIKPKENHEDDENGWENEENDENCNDAEFEAINAQLDQLNSVLDNLEQKNDDIRAELIQLLQSNREARKQFQEFQDSVKPNL